MFRKKEGVRSTGHNEIPARLVKKNGTHQESSPPIRSGTSYSGFVRQQQQSFPDLYRQPVYQKQYSDRGIPSNDISESYLNHKQSWQQQQQQPTSAPNSVKGVRKFAPAFLLRKKKHQGAANHPGFETNNIVDEEDETDIARLEDFTEQESINPVILGQLDDSQLNTVEQQGNYDKMYQRRLEYILSNYQKPPPYPGTKKDKKIKQAEQLSSQLQHQDTPLLKQLLKDKQLTDNASMNNFWQAGPAHNSQSKQLNRGDKLVNRTQNNPVVQTENSKELYEKRKQHYMFKANEIGHKSLNHDNENNRDAISEIIYPEKDYEQIPNQISLSASVPDLTSMGHNARAENRNSTTPRKLRDRIEPGELEALIAHYRKTSLDTFEPYGMSGESISLYSSEDSTSYVPPSPYMSAEIPDWLQVYAKASPELDEYLKWEMFRYPELDCWQTMLKRLYKKELEQVVLWFEEYRLALSAEMCRQEQIMFQEHYNSQQTNNIQNEQATSISRPFDPQSPDDYINLRKTDV